MTMFSPDHIAKCQTCKPSAWLDDGDVRLYHGGALEVLRSLPAGSVQTCVTSPPYWGLRSYLDDGHADKGSELGLERTPTEYVAALVAVFAEVWRVLRADGTLWLNLGDSYAAAGGAQVDGTKQVDGSQVGAWRGETRRPAEGLKAKDLAGVPWRVAFALQEAGWYLRSDIIWAKPNPMPESVTDRPTKAHEYVFLLAKQPKYYYDADSIREPAEYGRREWSDAEAVLASATTGNDKRPDHGIRRKASAGGDPSAGRNARSVWEIATQPTPDAHFATFPEALVRRCILAGTSERGGCAKCGAPWQRVVERAKPPVVAASEIDRYGTGDAGVHRKVGGQYQKWLDENPAQTTGWAPSCKCGAPAVPQQVLDPFVGSGTTALVARKHGRRATGVDLSADYLAIAARRLGQQSLFALDAGGAA